MGGGGVTPPPPLPTAEKATYQKRYILFAVVFFGYISPDGLGRIKTKREVRKVL
jgi:hypothetical protein